MKRCLLWIGMFVMILVMAVIDILGIAGILSQNVVIPLLLPFIIVMLILFVLILKGENVHETRDR
ncbi:MAG: hypothetical protein IJ206_12155 [Oscillospiraceae bacterium]|nr:hypothetical protein [Oscillospiraceae bacterium]